VAYVGEGNTTTINPSSQMLHKQLTVIGSWVFGLWQLRELADFLVRHDLHPGRMVTHRFPLERIDEALRLFDTGRTGKVMIEWSEDPRDHSTPTRLCSSGERTSNDGDND
jgi:threonine dehydrogenase-like Zn-dependent dehydrogenase